MGPNGLSVVKFMKSCTPDVILKYCSRVLEVENKNSLKELEIDFSEDVEPGAEAILIAVLMSLMGISCFPWEIEADPWPPRQRRLSKLHRPSKEFLLECAKSHFSTYKKGLFELPRNIIFQESEERHCYPFPDFREI